MVEWSLGNPATGWLVGYQSIGLSQLSLEYVVIPLAATKAGVSYNPTSDTLKFAFMPTPTQVPQVSDWVSGVWESNPSNPIYPYNAKCLVGPGGTTNPGVGNYVVYLQITDNPEIPVLPGAQLQIS